MRRTQSEEPKVLPTALQWDYLHPQLVEQLLQPHPLLRPKSPLPLQLPQNRSRIKIQHQLSPHPLQHPQPSLENREKRMIRKKMLFWQHIIAASLNDNFKSGKLSAEAHCQGFSPRSIAFDTIRYSEKGGGVKSFYKFFCDFYLTKMV